MKLGLHGPSKAKALLELKSTNQRKIHSSRSGSACSMKSTIMFALGGVSLSVNSGVEHAVNTVNDQMSALSFESQDTPKRNVLSSQQSQLSQAGSDQMCQISAAGLSDDKIFSKQK